MIYNLCCDIKCKCMLIYDSLLCVITTEKGFGRSSESYNKVLYLCIESQLSINLICYLFAYRRQKSFQTDLRISQISQLKKSHSP